MNEFERPPDLDKPGKGHLSERDQPEQYPTEQESLLDRFVSERNVDAIPVEDLKLQSKDEANKDKTKNDSSSERKYNGE